MAKEQEFEFIEDLERTGFFKIFHTNEYNYPEKLFANENWSVIIYELDTYLFNEGNHKFIEYFYQFFKSISNYIYITSSLFDGVESYKTVKFLSQTDLKELPYIIPNPDGQNILTNFTGDFFWGEEDSWGIFHDQYNGILIFGYDKKIEKEVEIYLYNHPNKIPSKELCSRFEYNYLYFKREATNEEVQDYLSEIKKNNKWF